MLSVALWFPILHDPHRCCCTAIITNDTRRRRRLGKQRGCASTLPNPPQPHTHAAAIITTNRWPPVRKNEAWFLWRSFCLSPCARKLKGSLSNEIIYLTIFIPSKCHDKYRDSARARFLAPQIRTAQEPTEHINKIMNKKCRMIRMRKLFVKRNAGAKMCTPKFVRHERRLNNACDFGCYCLVVVVVVGRSSSISLLLLMRVQWDSNA